MGDGQDGAGEAFQITFQPLHRMEIQVVGGLVQQQDVGVLQNEATQVHPGLLAAGERGEGLLAHGIGDAQAVADFIDLHRCIIASGQFEVGAELVIPLHHRPAGVAGGHLFLQFLHFFFDPPHPLEGGFQHRFHGAALWVDGNLRDQPHPVAGGDGDFPLIVVQLAGEDFEQGALAAAVFTQQAHPLALVDVESQAV